jgi:hypothetical protein
MNRAAKIHPARVRAAIRRSQVQRALDPSPWDLTNKILYDLCRKYPTRTEIDVILAKMQIIGRVYEVIDRRGHVCSWQQSRPTVCRNLGLLTVYNGLRKRRCQRLCGQPRHNRILR